MAPRSALLCLLLLATATTTLSRPDITLTSHIISQRRLLQNGTTSSAPGPAAAPAPVNFGNGTAAVPVSPASSFVYNPSGTYPYVPALFVFGDSLVDTGNNVLLGLPSYVGLGYPYGVGPRGRLNVTGRFSNGPLIVDYLAEFMGLPFTTPILLPGGNFYSGANFASGGSGALNSTGTPGRVLPLSNQTQLFTQLVRDSIAYWQNASNANVITPLYPRPETFGAALYTYTTGSNDLRGFTGNVSDFPAYAQSILTSIGTSITTTYAYGARNFLVFNVPLVGCVPAVRNLSATGECSAAVVAAAQGLSAGLDTLVGALRAQLPNSTFVVFDALNATTAAIAYPAAFGLTNANSSCCGAGGPANTAITCGAPGSTVCPNPEQYLFWDTLHATTSFYQLLAREAFGGNTFIRPRNLLDTFVRPNLLGCDA
ncbi:hypothetical protein KFL_002180170 [Klebsormidium nitens]|uniref:GDSL esterase/lipase n=1 Tax=Klebsormidium nitens TaxID=105231 RepID=A0A1Y1I3H7_KLENI|nr:hypothetical protein KFL_002180170 [Klebsormidium nitens]|eukprot:GAQ85043.1 hypothetical protein KFL_002180170 [Klebsormidium nitens]